MNDRERAFHILRRVEREAAFAAPLLHSETGFVRTLVLGVLRWQLKLDHLIATAAARRIEKIDPVVVLILRIGVYQLTSMEVARYAAVSETVDLANKYAKRAGGFVNAVLRKASTTTVASPSLAIETSHPEWLLARWTRTYGAERTRAIAMANQELSYPDVFVVNGLPPEESTPSLLVDDMYKLHGPTPEGYDALDEGSAVIATIAARAGSDVLDLAAAPGGKTLVMRGRGARVVSNDVSLARLMPLVGRGARIVVSDGRRPPFAKPFQSVLLDAPCSATGTIRKNPELKWRLREADLSTFATLQRELLASALTLARETVVYSTCSLEPEENDAVIDDALAANGDFTRADIADYAPPQIAPWIDNGVLRLTPESGADGFTAFVLVRAHS